MINRENWLIVSQYLQYLSQVLLLCEETVSRRREQLRHLLEWLGAKPFNQMKSIILVFSLYILTARNDGKDKPLSPASVKQICETIRRFLAWGKINHPRKFSNITPGWIDTIRPARQSDSQSELKNHEYYTLEELIKIADLKLDNLRDIRDQAAMCFMFLSAIRVGAFVSLPIKCVDINNLRVDQLPSAGVLTKNRKAARTSLYQIPELLKCVVDWDSRVQASLQETAAWYSAIDQTGSNLVPIFPSSTGRREKVNDGIKRLCKMAGVTYKSSHKLRHGNVIFGLKNAKDIQGVKAISQNAMHASLVTTDGVYGVFSYKDVHDIITKISPEIQGQEVNTELVRKLADLADILKSNPKILDFIQKNES